MLINFTAGNYPFSSYIPSRYAAGTFAAIVYVSLMAWFLQSLYYKGQPLLLNLYIFVSHLCTFIELVLRATLTTDVLNTPTLYQVTALLCSSSPRLLLVANYRCLVELRGKTPGQPLDRFMDTIVPLSVIIMDGLLCLADELSFDPTRHHVSFHLRQASNGFILGLAIFFYISWYLTVSRVRRLYVLPLLTISSTCVLTETIYTLAMSIPSIFVLVSTSEFAYYVCHVIPLFLALITWSAFHPWRLLPPPEAVVPRDASGNELLPPPPSIS